MLTNLDILRSFAILAVFLAHWALTLSGNGPDERMVCGVDVYALGGSGVLIFFVHTSIVLMKSLQRSGESGFRLFGAFYLRRLFRIYPLSVLLCFVVVIFTIPRDVVGTEYWGPGKIGFLSNIILAQNLTGVPPLSNPMWSLPYEVQMYLLLPAIFLCIQTERWLPRFIVVMTLGIVGARTFAPAEFVPNFLCGVMAFCLMKKSKPRWPAQLWPVVIVAALGGYWAVTSGKQNSFVANLALCLVLGAALPYFKDSTAKRTQICTHNLAKYSYGIYLCHYPLMWVFYRKLGHLPPLAQHLGLFASVILISVSCYHLIEHPMIRLGAWLATKRPVVSGGEMVPDRSAPPG